MKQKKGNKLRDKAASKSTATGRPSITATASTSFTPNDDGIWKDPRFAHLVTDPRFKSMHKTTKKVKIDKRFAGMFNDDKFNVKYSTDKYGRRSTKTSSDDMKKYYAMSSDDDEETTDAIEQEKEEKQMLAEAQMEKVESEEEIPDELKAKLKDLSVDYARGEGKLMSDSSSDEDSSGDEQDDELFIDHVWGELDAEAPHTDESSRRLAACNMDWDRIRACDIMVLCSSFLPPGGSIVSVTIYPSEFGKERMAEEEIKGPQELTDRTRDESDDAESDDSRAEQQDEEGNDFNMEKLRQYQLNRLKYYYAVIECDRVSTADKLYAECDGLEYESTATKLDLRFVPDDMAFDDQPKDVCTELPDMSKYMPRLFTTTALQQAKVELTWDENDVERKELSDKLMAGKLNEVPDQELRKYVAYSSEDDSDDDGNDVEPAIVEEKPEVGFAAATKPKNSIAKYKALLQEIQTREDKEKNQRIEMEYSWHIGGGGSTDKVDTDEAAAAVSTNNADKTHFDKILEYKQEKKKQRKVDKKKKLKLLKSGKTGSDPDDDSDSDDSDLPDGIDLNDPYFAEEFANGDFGAAKENGKKSKKKKAKNEDATDSETEQKAAELALLLDDDDDDGKAHFSLKKIQSTENESKTKKRRKKNLKRTKRQNEVEKALLDDDFRIDVNDTRFTPIYSSHLYSIDPTHASYKKTKGMEALIREKLKRRPVDLDAVDERTVVKVPKKDVAVSMLVKSIKRKIQN